MLHVRSFAATCLAVALLSPAGLATAQSPQTAPASDLPSAEEIQKESVKALGGEEAIAKIESLHTVMESTMQAMDMKIETFWSRDGGRLVTMSAPMGEMQRGSDGETAWMKTPAGYQLLSDEQADQMSNQAGMFMNILEPQRHTRESLESLEVVGREPFGGADAYKLRFVNKSGEKGFMYYDVKSKLPIGFESITETAGQEEQVVISDWKEQDGVQFFRKMTITSADGAAGAPANESTDESTQESEPADESSGESAAAPATVKVTTLEVNKVDEAVFALPEEVKSLAESKPSEGMEGKEEIAFEDLTPQQQAQATQMLDRLKGAGDVNAMQQMVEQLEPIMAMVPPEERPMMQYVLQELKKEIKRLGG